MHFDKVRQLWLAKAGGIMSLRLMEIILVLSMFLSGCTSITKSLSPFPHQAELNSFAERVGKKIHSSEESKLGLVKRELILYRDELYEKAMNRSSMDWNSSSAVTYGGIAAVAGSIAERAALTNVGAITALLGLTTSSQYKFQQQSKIYLAALKKISCIYGKIIWIDERTLNMAAGSTDPVAVNASENLVNATILTVDQVRVDYTDALLGLTPSILSKEELIAMFGQYPGTRNLQAASTANASADPDQLAKNQAGILIMSVSDEIKACSKMVF